jgi:uncharacterized membrane protein required for colicin V production
MLPDIIVIAVLLLFILLGAHKGFVRTFFDFFSFVLALFAAHFLHPFVSGVLRQSGGLYDFLKSWIADSMGLNALIVETGKAAETQFINALPLPSIITQPLIENNNPEIYKLLDVSSIETYVAGFIANIMISAAALLAAFLLALIGIRLIAAVLDLAAKLPIINSLNKTGGAVTGFLQGIIALWVLVAIFSFVFARSENPEIYHAVQSSMLAKYFYENNLILNMIIKIFP